MSRSAMKIVLSIAALILAAGCASLPGEDCGSDWYQVGRRDALLFRIQPQADLIQRQCPQADTARYMQGWREGSQERRSSAL